MTLEGEYYENRDALCPHTNRRNPHDIGRRILRREIKSTEKKWKVAILMTLEGEYYN